MLFLAVHGGGKQRATGPPRAVLWAQLRALLFPAKAYKAQLRKVQQEREQKEAQQRQRQRQRQQQHQRQRHSGAGAKSSPPQPLRSAYELEWSEQAASQLQVYSPAELRRTLLPLAALWPQLALEADKLASAKVAGPKVSNQRVKRQALTQQLLANHRRPASAIARAISGGGAQSTTARGQAAWHAHGPASPLQRRRVAARATSGHGGTTGGGSAVRSRGRQEREPAAGADVAHNSSEASALAASQASKAAGTGSRKGPHSRSPKSKQERAATRVSSKPNSRASTPVPADNLNWSKQMDRWTGLPPTSPEEWLGSLATLRVELSQIAEVRCRVDRPQALPAYCAAVCPPPGPARRLITARGVEAPVGRPPQLRSSPHSSPHSPLPLPPLQLRNPPDAVRRAVCAALILMSRVSSLPPSLDWHVFCRPRLQDTAMLIMRLMAFDAAEPVAPMKVEAVRPLMEPQAVRPVHILSDFR